MRKLIPQMRWTRGVLFYKGRSFDGSLNIEFTFTEHGFAMWVVGWCAPFDFYAFNHAASHGMMEE